MNKTTFSFVETQRFTQWWIWLPLFGMLVLVLWPLLGREPVDEDQIRGIGIGVTAVLFTMGILFITKLETRAYLGKLQFRFFPFIWSWRTYDWSEIQSIELKQYNSLKAYGGWGIRTNFEIWAYNVRGNQGLLVQTKSKTFKLGTQKPQEAAALIEAFLAYKPNSNAS